MTMPVRLLLVIAALAYSLMPLTGMAGPAMASTTTAISEIAIPGDCPHASSGHAGKMSDPASPHPEGTKFTGHCSACLALPAEPLAWVTEAAPRGAEASALSPRFASVDDGPLLPPPRI